MFVLKHMLAKREGGVAAGGLGHIPQTNGQESSHAGLLRSCANPDCRSGWIHPWRRRSVPVFEEGWTCSPDCTFSLLRAAVSRECSGNGIRSENHRHRIPLGLLMLEQGWISRTELQRALAAQRASGAGRLGQWLIRNHATNEETVTRSLALQWSCPVLHADPQEAEALNALMPRLFIDAFGALPLRLAAGKLLYIGFEEALDPALALALEHMTGLRVESGIVPESEFRRVHAQLLKSRFPPVELVEALSPTAAADALARSVERALPVSSRLVRVHDCLWLRLGLRPQSSVYPKIDAVEDVVCSVGRLQG
jgi:hypothetical protein